VFDIDIDTRVRVEFDVFDRHLYVSMSTS